jgi:hypothetical protein
MVVFDDRGVDDWMTTTENLSSNFTIAFLESISESNSGPVVVFLDNAYFNL